MIMRWVLAAVIGVGLAVSTVELSCLAEEHRAAGPAPAASIRSRAAEPDLPGVLDGDVSETLTYTR